jgi:hypothetical protein
MGISKVFANFIFHLAAIVCKNFGTFVGLDK